LRIPVSLTGAGRTDAGVHAADFYAHFELNDMWSEEELKRLVFRLNRFLCDEISVSSIFPVHPRAHARFNATSRTYRYCVARSKNPFRRNYSHYVYGPIDTELMNEGAAVIMHYNDFTSFSKVDTDTRTNICTITSANWEMEGNELVFTITADRFLRNMVRSIVGTLLELGLGKISIGDLKVIIESKNRSNAGDSMPSKGLVLHRIVYPENIYLQ